MRVTRWLAVGRAPTSNFGDRSQGAFRHLVGYVNDVCIAARRASGTSRARGSSPPREARIIFEAQRSAATHTKRAAAAARGGTTLRCT